jgi:hypothetical protein
MLTGQVFYCTGTVGTNEHSSETELSIYPNPVTDYLKIETAMRVSNVQITDIVGQLLYSNNAKTIDCSAFSKGIYLIRIESERGIAVKEFIKQ